MEHKLVAFGNNREVSICADYEFPLMDGTTVDVCRTKEPENDFIILDEPNTLAVYFSRISDTEVEVICSGQGTHSMRVTKHLSLARDVISICDGPNSVYNPLAKAISDQHIVFIANENTWNSMCEFLFMIHFLAPNMRFPVVPLAFRTDIYGSTVLVGSTQGMIGTKEMDVNTYIKLQKASKCIKLFDDTEFVVLMLDTYIPQIDCSILSLHLLQQRDDYVVAAVHFPSTNVRARRKFIDCCVMHQVIHSYKAVSDVVYLYVALPLLHAMIKEQSLNPVVRINEDKVRAKWEPFDRNEYPNIEEYMTRYKIPDVAQSDEIRRLKAIFLVKELSELNEKVTQFL